MHQPQANSPVEYREIPKRGRGRPRVAHPLTPAERARRYRLKRKAEGREAGRPGSEAPPLRKSEAGASAELPHALARIADLERENARLRARAAGLQQWTYDAAGAFQQILSARAGKKGISAALVAGIEKLLALPVFDD